MKTALASWAPSINISMIMIMVIIMIMIMIVIVIVIVIVIMIMIMIMIILQEKRVITDIVRLKCPTANRASSWPGLISVFVSTSH